MVVTTDSIPGKHIVRTIGLVKGSVVRARHVGQDILAGLQHLVGGEISGYTKLVEESRDQCLDRMIEHALSQGANAIITVRLTTSVMMGGTAELLAYGTGVIVEDAQTI